jgi:hypothetical protein
MKMRLTVPLSRADGSFILEFKKENHKIEK